MAIAKKGFNDPRSGKGFVTRARAQEKLTKLLTEKAPLVLATLGSRKDNPAETIILRDADKNSEDYEDTAITRQMRNDLALINSKLQQHWIDIRLTNDQLVTLKQDMRGDHEAGHRDKGYIDFAQKRLVRIFNNSNFGHGGRFYGGWWQNIPSDYRKCVTIDTNHTAELDYSGLHVAMLYAEKGLKLEGDAYDLGSIGVPREVIKNTFQKLLNADGQIDHRKYDKRKYPVTWNELVSRIKQHHKPIREFLGTGAGVRLQNKDAELANTIMLRFLEMGYVCLPVHDSFLVHYALADELRKIMSDEFSKTTGQEIEINAKEVFQYPKGTGLVIESIANILDCTGPYSNYEQRQQDFYRWKSCIRA